MRQISLKNKLLVTIIPLMIITIAILMFISYWQSSKVILSQNTEYLAKIVQRTVDELTLWLEEREREITLISQESLLLNACLEQGSAEAQQRLTSYHQHSPAYEAIFLTNPQGAVFMNSTRQQIGLDLSKTPEYAENITQAQQGKVWMSAAGLSPDSGNPVVLITAPMMVNGNVVGILGTSLDLTHFSDMRISQQKIGKNGYFTMIDQMGRFLAHPNKSIILTKGGQEDEIFAKKQGQRTYLWQGVEKIMQFQTCARNGWVVVATIEKNELFETIEKTRNLAILLSLVSVSVVSLEIWRLMVKNLVKPIRETVEYVKKVSAGDISETFAVTRQDELGELLQAMSQMIIKLRQVVSNVKNAAENVADGSQAISSGASEMSNGATEQAAAGEEASSSMEEMSANIRQNAENATQTEKIAIKAANDAQKSGEAVAQTVTAMREIVRKITIIEEIARQTHTLSLNATIEAAKAQEYGKGFAVVAAEVRALASRSQDASSEINQMASQSIDTAERAGDMLSTLVPDIQKTADLVQEIGAASREQSSGVEQISRAIQQLDTVIQQNSSISEEMAATSEELAGQAEQLQEMIAFFHTGEAEQQQTKQRQAHRKKPRGSVHVKEPIAKGIEHSENLPTGDRLDEEFERY